MVTVSKVTFQVDTAHQPGVGRRPRYTSQSSTTRSSVNLLSKVGRYRNYRYKEIERGYSEDRG